tara:strand:+ start:163 stop:318 length:156 start_codon:yes stop_codon:yes gene_type:complete
VEVVEVVGLVEVILALEIVDSTEEHLSVTICHNILTMILKNGRATGELPFL